MKFKNKIKILIFMGIFITGMNLFGNNLGNRIDNNKEISEDFDNLETSAIYNGIFIDDTMSSNGPTFGNWTWARTQPWCTTGNGTQDSPYIIEDLTFLSAGPSDCLSIHHSRKFFVIRNCIFRDIPAASFAGIKLINVSNGQITNNLAYNNALGFFLDNVNNSKIINNNASNNFYGIRLDNSYDNIIMGNIANNNIELAPDSYFGIGLFYCANNTISGNNANNNGDYGILLDNSDNSKIINNNASNNGNVGISVRGALSPNYRHNISIFNNKANDNIWFGIIADSCLNGNITGNTANHNGYNGMRIWDCSNSIISENYASNNGRNGIAIEDSQENLVSANEIYDNGFSGLVLEYGILYPNEYNNITKNRIYNNTQNGMVLQFSSHNKVWDNEIHGNKRNGIYLVNWTTAYGFSLSNEIYRNLINENGVNGINFSSTSDNNLIYNNFFLKNGNHAVDEGSDNTWNSTSIGNYWDNHTGPDITPQDGIVDDPYTYIGGDAGSIDYLPIAEDGAPRITILSPEEGDRFKSTAPTFELEIVDVYVYEMWYTLDGGLNNYTFTENGTIDQSAWDALPDGTITIIFYARDIGENEAFVEVSVIKDISAGGLDPGVITTIIVVSVVGGIALIGAVYIFLKKRKT